MIKLKHIVVCSIILLASISIKAQGSININIGKPDWAPVAAPEVEYYYLPEVDSYYDIRNKQFISLSNGRWARTKTLPGRYKNYDLYKGNTVVISDYRGRSPYTKYKFHKVKYHKSNNGNHKNIGDKPQYKSQKSKSHGGKKG